jgi:uncharacterized membrane protein YbhN (UPF0104 family)
MSTPQGADPIRPSLPARRRRWLLGVIRLVLAVTILGYLVHVVPVGELVARFAAIAAPWIVLAALLQLAVQLLSASTLAILLGPQGLAVPIARIFAVNLASAFYNLLTPAGTIAGGAVRWYRLGYQAGRMPEVLAALVANRLLDITTLTGLAFAAWLLAPLSGAAVGLAAVPGLLFAGSALAYAGLFNRPLALRLIVLLRRLVPAGGRLRRLALRVLMAQRAQACLSGRAQARLVTLSLVRHLTAAGLLYALALGLELEIGLVILVWVRSLTNLVIMLPASFAGLGVREAIFVTLLQAYDVPPAQALLLALLASTLALLPAALGGLLALLRPGIRHAGRAARGVQ